MLDICRLLFLIFDFDVTLVHVFSSLLFFVSFRIVLLMSSFSINSFLNISFSVFNCFILLFQIFNFFVCSSFFLLKRISYRSYFKLFIVNSFDVRWFIYLYLFVRFIYYSVWLTFSNISSIFFSKINRFLILILNLVTSISSLSVASSKNRSLPTDNTAIKSTSLKYIPINILQLDFLSKN